MAMINNNDVFVAQVMLTFDGCTEDDFSTLIDLYLQSKADMAFIIDDLFNCALRIDNFDRQKVDALLNFLLKQYPDHKREIEQNRINLRLNYMLEDVTAMIKSYKTEFGEDMDILTYELTNIMRRQKIKISDLAEIMAKIDAIKDEGK